MEFNTFFNQAKVSLGTFFWNFVFMLILPFQHINGLAQAVHEVNIKVKEYPEYIGHFLLEFFPNKTVHTVEQPMKSMDNLISGKPIKVLERQV